MGEKRDNNSSHSEDQYGAKFDSQIIFVTRFDVSCATGIIIVRYGNSVNYQLSLDRVPSGIPLICFGELGIPIKRIHSFFVLNIWESCPAPGLFRYARIALLF